MTAIIHFKEDTAKPENRTNLALFSILMIPEVHDFLCTHLEILHNIIICPSPNLQTEEFALSSRPDFKVVKSLDDKDIFAYIEIELGKEDESQISNYRSLTNKRIYSIVGKKSYREGMQGKGDLSLEEIHNFAKGLKEKYLNSQQHASLELFCNLVQYYVEEESYNLLLKRSNLSEKMLNTTLIQAVFDHFGRDNILGTGNIKRGHISLDTITENGFSLRVYSTETRMGVSLMSRSGGRPTIEFPSWVKLKKYFPYKVAEVEEFVNVIFALGAYEIKSLSEKQRAKLGLETVENNFGKIAKTIEGLL
jgi:hypothetical protein